MKNQLGQNDVRKRRIVLDARPVGAATGGHVRRDETRIRQAAAGLDSGKRLVRVAPS